MLTVAQTVELKADSFTFPTSPPPCVCTFNLIQLSIMFECLPHVKPGGDLISHLLIIFNIPTYEGKCLHYSI